MNNRPSAVKTNSSPVLASRGLRIAIPIMAWPLFLVLCLAHASERDAVQVHGTLVVTIPTADGLIVASDSRGSLGGGRFCDEVAKIAPLKRHAHSVVAITGTARISSKSPEGTPACDGYKHKAQFDFLQLAARFLDSQSGVVSSKSFNNLRDFMLKKVRKSQRETPDISEDAEGVNAIFGSYDPKTKTAVIGLIEICVGKGNGEAETCGETWTEFHQDDPAYFKATGADDFRLIQNGKAVQYLHSISLTPFYVFANESKSVSQVSSSEGIRIASILILATEELTNLPGHDRSVHGPVQAYLLNEQDAPLKLK
jgi:hypothetical protein